MNRIVLDSELNALCYYLRCFDLSFLGARACDCAKELSQIIEEHLTGLSLFNDIDPDDYSL